MIYANTKINTETKRLQIKTKSNTTKSNTKQTVLLMVKDNQPNEL